MTPPEFVRGEDPKKPEKRKKEELVSSESLRAARRRSTRELTSKESADEHSFDVLSASATDVEEDEGEVGDEENVLSSPLLRGGRKDKRTECETKL